MKNKLSHLGSSGMLALLLGAACGPKELLEVGTVRTDHGGGAGGNLPVGSGGAGGSLLVGGAGPNNDDASRGGAAGADTPVNDPGPLGGRATLPVPPQPPQSATGGCANAAQPTLFAQPIGITGMQIALTETHVYWNDGSAVVRQPKAGGAPENVVAVRANSARIAATVDRLFWEEGSDIVGASIAAPAAGKRVAGRVITGEWAVSGDRLSYLIDPLSGAGGTSGFDPKLPSTLESIPLGGGASLRARLTAPSSLDTVAADATGVYWFYNQRNDPAYFGGGGVGGGNAAPDSCIQKLTYASGQVSYFAPAVSLNPFGLQTDGEWVVWSDYSDDGTTVYQAKPDGSMLRGIGLADVVRGIAVHGSTAFWAAGHPGDERSDIWSAPLGDSSTPRLVACDVQSVDGLRADANDIYYFTYTENPIIGRIPRPAP